MIHECGSHVYRAFDAWPKFKDRNNDAKDVKNYDDRFSTGISLLANRVRDIDDIYFAMEEFFLLMAMLPHKTIYCPGFDIYSTTQYTYDEDEAMILAL